LYIKRAAKKILGLKKRILRSNEVGFLCGLSFVHFLIVAIDLGFIAFTAIVVSLELP
jgi:hypothetical protein